MGKFRKNLAVGVGVMASLALVTPPAQAAQPGAVPLHYSCGQTRPPNLDGSPVVTATGSAALLRGSSGSCGFSGAVIGGDKLDYYCWTLGNDGNTYTYVSNYLRGEAGWAWDTQIPNNGSDKHCPI